MPKCKRFYAPDKNVRTKVRNRKILFRRKYREKYSEETGREVTNAESFALAFRQNTYKMLICYIARPLRCVYRQLSKRSQSCLSSFS